MSSKILLVEDDKTLLEVLKYNLVKEGYNAVTASDGISGLDIARQEKPDLIILDVMLPGMNGLEVCRILRRETSSPILMLTAKVEEVDKVVGLELGADDYITKPFSMRELLARIKAMLRRTEIMKQELSPLRETIPARLKHKELEIDITRHKVYSAGRDIDLGPKEFELLVFLMRNRGQVFSREQLLDKVWGYDYAGETRTVDVHVRWLREKIEADAENPAYILTVRGFGYKFEE